MKLSIHENASEYIVCEMAAISSWGRWVNKMFMWDVDVGFVYGWASMPYSLMRDVITYACPKFSGGLVNHFK